MKTYVVRGSRDEHPRFRYEEIIYAGQDKDEAFNISIEDYKILTLDVWVKGLKMESYVKKDIHDWILAFNKVDDLKRSINGAKKRLTETTEELHNLEKLLKD